MCAQLTFTYLSKQVNVLSVVTVAMLLIHNVYGQMWSKCVWQRATVTAELRSVRQDDWLASNTVSNNNNKQEEYNLYLKWEEKRWAIKIWSVTLVFSAHAVEIIAGTLHGHPGNYAQAVFPIWGISTYRYKPLKTLTFWSPLGSGLHCSEFDKSATEKKHLDRQSKCF